jgi:chorismate-pyruvate lyase
MRKEKSTTSSQGTLWEDVPLLVHLTRAALRSCLESKHPTSATTGTADIGAYLEMKRVTVRRNAAENEGRYEKILNEEKTSDKEKYCLRRQSLIIQISWKRH